MSKTWFTKDHEWLSIDGDTAVVGITQFAQEQLGDLVFVELPEVGGEIVKGECVVVIESVKAAGEIHSPVDGEILAINEKLLVAPETVNTDPEGDGWFYKIKVTSDMGESLALMNKEDYASYLDA